jgi:hypothetical protein
MGMCELYVSSHSHSRHDQMLKYTEWFLHRKDVTLVDIHHQLEEVNKVCVMPQKHNVMLCFAACSFTSEIQRSNYSGIIATSIFHMWYKWIYMYLYVSTDDSTQQFPNSEHPITFTSNTGCSLGLYSHEWELLLHTKERKKILHQT